MRVLTLTTVGMAVELEGRQSSVTDSSADSALASGTDVGPILG